MNETMTVILFVAVIGLMFAAAFVKRLRQVISDAVPDGWEDEQGFHRGQKGDE